MRSKRAWAVVWAVFLVLAGFAAVFVVKLYAFGGQKHSRGPDPATQVATAFLADWSAGRYDAAAARTDDPTAAAASLKSFTSGLEISHTGLRPGVPRDSTATPRGKEVPFTAVHAINGLGEWTYGSTVPLVRESTRWVVHWSPAVVHPKLSTTVRFHLVRTDDGPDFADRKGRPLTGRKHPSLGPVLAELGRRAPGGGSGGGAIQLVARDSGDVQETVISFKAKNAGTTLRTTLDERAQAAAEDAVGDTSKHTALVALDTGTGGILAVVNSPGGFNRAMSGRYAPGSTMKILTSAALLRKGAVRLDEKVPCPKAVTVGRTFHNIKDETFPDATFRKDFAASCNTAFVKLRTRLDDGELHQVAAGVFGIGADWHAGVPTFDGSVPVPGNDTEKAAAAFGQGQVLMNPLTMASVVATASSGQFHQPVLLADQAGSGGGSQRLSPAVVGQLRALMRSVVTSGTAHGVLGSLPGYVGAKTGTAEVGGQDENNSWLVAFRGDVAVACLVERGGRGIDAAGPIVRDFLRAVA